MRLSRLLLAASAAILLASAAQAAPAAHPPAMMGAGGGGAMRGMFTREERMVLLADGFKATAGMTEDQEKAYRAERRAKILAISGADLAKFKADLDARWAAMPADQKKLLTDKVQAFVAAHHPGPAAQ